MVRFTIPFLLIYFISFTNSSCAQPKNYYINLCFSEWMDTTGFTNPDNFIWSDGLITLSSSLIDTSTALLVISEPETNKWYCLQVSNVYDKAGNLINSDLDTAGFVLKPASLPVELISFKAKLISETVHLTWITKTEVNNYGFDVERIQLPLNPLPGGEEKGWVHIGFVKGNGNSNSPKLYSYEDNNLIGGSRFKYRLKQIDTDGTFEYSDEIEVELIPDNYALFQNYPNPFNPVTKIRYQLPVESKVNITIYSITGERVWELKYDNKQAGTFEEEFNAENLASGVYLYRIIAKGLKSKTGESFIETKKMILLR